ncbi:hypothetical protein M0R04_15465 [Candidatus Dojkabacteria bacterium]|jgi:hypothetical protein|nr:hypothetical protein [Candidatus Dojkabacteria bacterium]
MEEIKKEFKRFYLGGYGYLCEKKGKYVYAGNDLKPIWQFIEKVYKLGEENGYKKGLNTAKDEEANAVDDFGNPIKLSLG